MKNHPDYDLLEELARGAHTAVFRAHHTKLSQFVAVKQLNEDVGADPDRLRQLKQAVQLLANLPDYDHIVRVLDVVPENGWLVLELMQGSMADRVSADGKGLPQDLVRSVLRQALEGLRILHRAERLHGNLKPSNLLINDRGRVKIADSPGLIFDGIVRPPDGSPKYLAPERIEPTFGDVGPATDLYSLGFTALELLVGSGFDKVFRGTGADAVDPHVGWLRLHGSEEALPSAAKLVPGLAPDLARVIDRMLQKKVADRYAKARHALEDLAAGAEVAVQLPGKPKPGSAFMDTITLTPSKQPTQSPPSPVEVPEVATDIAKPAGGSKKWALWGLLALIPVALFVVGFLLLSDSPPESVEITISTTPPGAEVTFLDPNNPTKPASKYLTNNKYTVRTTQKGIRLALAGFETREETIDPATKTDYSFALKEAKKAEALVKLLLKSEPSGAQVRIDDVLQSSPTPLEIILSPGKHRITLRKTDYEDGILDLAIDPKAPPKELPTVQMVALASGTQHAKIPMDAGLNKVALEHFGRGKELLKIHQNREALREFEAAFKLEPKFPLARAYAGLACTSLKDLPAALQHCKEAIAQDATLAEGYAFRCEVHADMQEWQKALEDGRKAIELNGKLARAHRNLGYTFVQMGAFHRAVEAYDQAIRWGGDTSFFWGERGDLRLRFKEFDSAITDFTRAIALDPKDLDGKLVFHYSCRARAYYQLGGVGPAIADWTAVIERDGTNHPVFNSRGDLYFEQGNYKQAILDYTSAYKLHQDHVYLINRARAYLRLGNEKEALIDLNLVLLNNKGNRVALLLRAEVHEALGNSAAAVNDRRLAEGVPTKLVPPPLQKGGPRATLTGHTGPVFGVAFHPTNGKELVSASSDALRVWDLTTAKSRAPFKGDAGRHGAIAFSPDGEVVVSGMWAAEADPSAKGELQAWNAASRLILYSNRSDHRAVSSVTFSPVGKSLATVEGDIFLYDAASGRRLRALTGHTSWVQSVAFDPEGKTLVSGSNDKSVRLWDVATGKTIATLNLHEQAVEAVAISPNGRIGASAGQDQTIKLWQAATLKVTATLTGHKGAVRAVAFSPDSKLLVSASADHTLKIWEVDTARCTATLEGHKGPVYAVAFSPNGRIIASGSQDQTVILWDVPDVPPVDIRVPAPKAPAPVASGTLQNSMIDASARLAKLIDEANQGGYVLQDNKFSIGGGWVKQSSQQWISLYTVPLTANTNYRFLAGGDNAAKDVDLEILDAAGKVLRADTDTASAARIDFTPAASGLYTVRLRLYDSVNQVPCFCFAVIMTEQKTNIRQGVYLTQASVRLSRLVIDAEKSGYMLLDNPFTLGGGWLTRGADQWTVFRLSLTGERDYRFLGVGDNDAQDVDLEVQDASGTSLKIDVRTSAEATVDITPKASGRYAVRLRLFASRENLPCLCLGIVMVNK